MNRKGTVPSTMTGGIAAYEEMSSLLVKMGFHLLEMKTLRMQQGLKVYVTVYSEGGVGVDDCAHISKTVLPRLEIMLGSRDISMEVASPGLERKLLSFEEFAVFTGRSARVLLENGTWLHGSIVGINDDILTLNVSGAMQELDRDQIMKAQLVYREGS